MSRTSLWPSSADRLWSAFRRGTAPTRSRWRRPWPVLQLARAADELPGFDRQVKQGCATGPTPRCVILQLIRIKEPRGQASSGNDN